METVEVLVRIPKKDFEELQSDYVWWGKHGDYIKNGAVLPKGHGRMIDANEIETILHDRAFDKAASKQFYEIIWAKNLIHDAPTVIEADKEVQNE